MTPTPKNRPRSCKSWMGGWTATGDVTGEPVQYDVPAAPALQAQFAEISMSDGSDTWTLEITAQQPDGSWKHFARPISIWRQ